MSPAGMSADAAAPRPVPGNRAGATERDSLDDDEEEDAPTPPSARSHATVASAMPPSAGGAAVGTDAFPLTSAVSSGGRERGVAERAGSLQCGRRRPRRALMRIREQLQHERARGGLVPRGYRDGVPLPRDGRCDHLGGPSARGGEVNLSSVDARHPRGGQEAHGGIRRRQRDRRGEAAGSHDLRAEPRVLILRHRYLDIVLHGDARYARSQPGGGWTRDRCVAYSQVLQKSCNVITNSRL